MHKSNYDSPKFMIIGMKVLLSINYIRFAILTSRESALLLPLFALSTIVGGSIYISIYRSGENLRK